MGGSPRAPPSAPPHPPPPGAGRTTTPRGRRRPRWPGPRRPPPRPRAAPHPGPPSPRAGRTAPRTPRSRCGRSDRHRVEPDPAGEHRHLDGDGGRHRVPQPEAHLRPAGPEGQVGPVRGEVEDPVARHEEPGDARARAVPGDPPDRGAEERRPDRGEERGVGPRVAHELERRVGRIARCHAHHLEAGEDRDRPEQVEEGRRGHEDAERGARGGPLRGEGEGEVSDEHARIMPAAAARARSRVGHATPRRETR